MTNAVVEKALRKFFGWKPGYVPEPTPEQAKEHLSKEKEVVDEGGSDRPTDG